MGAEAAAMPERVGRYEIILPIAKGGMATVYLARAEGVGGFGRYVALKLTASHLRSDPEFAAHLIEEAKLVAHLRHANVVPVYDVGECEHGVFLVMDYVPGDSFSGLRRTARDAGADLPRRVGLRILVDALHGLHAAHEHTDEEGAPLNLVHRDFSPQNILVGTDGIARLTDFGIAKAASRVSNTSAGRIKGKIRYVAPEQARGEPLDRRCDLWAAGVIAWELVTGQKLVTSSEGASFAAATTDPPRAQTVAPDVDAALDDVVARALRVDRTERIATAQELARALAAAARSVGWLAEPEEVAEHVTRLTGAELAERKTRLADARRQRKTPTPEVRTLIGMAAPPPPAARMPLPSLPEVPPPPASIPPPPGSGLRIDVVVGATPEDRVSEGILGPASLVPVEESAPEVFQSPVVAPASRWTTKKLIAGGAVGFVAVLLLGFAIGSALRRGGDPHVGASASASASVAETSPAPLPTPAEPAVVPTTAATSTEETQNEPSSLLRITANGPIASIRVADRVVDAVVPAPSVAVDLGEAEANATLRVVVTGTDGRIATATAAPGTRELDVSFGEKTSPPPAAAARAPAPKEKEKRTWPKRTVKN